MTGDVRSPEPRPGDHYRAGPLALIRELHAMDKFTDASMVERTRKILADDHDAAGSVRPCGGVIPKNLPPRHKALITPKETT